MTLFLTAISSTARSTESVLLKAEDDIGPGLRLAFGATNPVPFARASSAHCLHWSAVMLRTFNSGNPGHTFTGAFARCLSARSKSVSLNFATEDNLVLRLFHFSFPLIFTRA
jgi:hypothetical protein